MRRGGSARGRTVDIKTIYQVERRRARIAMTSVALVSVILMPDMQKKGFMRDEAGR